ncbi:uncharacterized protein LOC132606044 [Lycium barbarum]|uniref:uncharacterized protein LOC132606044 n=1 Tax=Lycium barbarum TaxID=112863 RepID=UPI00293E8DC3|nr:uncharacterized protein LOC132606044 [Lycium barbarum]
MTNYTHLEAVALDPHCSDHSPLAVEITDYPIREPRPFKFFNHLADHPDFLEIIQQTWAHTSRGMGMQHIWYKLKKVKQQLKLLNTREYSKVNDNVQKYRQELAAVQIQMRDPTILAMMTEGERELRQQLEKWATIEESILRQKSRVRWLQLGDSNNAYFFACMKGGVAQNQIRQLNTLTGATIQNEKDIEIKIIGFYKQLLRSSVAQLPVIHEEVLSEGHVLQREQQLKLMQPVTSEEIKDALMGIDDHKALGYDGYNALFFKKSWEVVVQGITNAVLRFFSIDELYKPINCTAVTLIPKIKNPMTIKKTSGPFHVVQYYTKSYPKSLPTNDRQQ